MLSVKATSAADAAQEALKLKEVKRYTQSNNRGFHKNEGRWWSQASPREGREVMVQVVRESKVERRFQMAAQRVQCMAWEGALQRFLNWGHVWKMVPLRLSFAVRSMYDLLTSATHLLMWGKIDGDACPSKRQTLEHVQVHVYGGSGTGPV